MTTLNPHIGILVPISIAVPPLCPAALFILAPNGHFKKKDFDGTVTVKDNQPSLMEAIEDLNLVIFPPSAPNMR